MLLFYYLKKSPNPANESLLHIVGAIEKLEKNDLKKYASLAIMSFYFIYVETIGKYKNEKSIHV